MITMKHFIKGALMLLTTLILFSSCSKDNDGTGPMGMAQFEITDSPVDDTNVKGAFVTITEVKVDGKVISSFSGKQTIDLLAYQHGNTKALGLAELEAGTYNNVTLVLDFEKDANGNSPGCYVLSTDNVKHSLQATSSSTGEIKINTGSFEVKEGSTTNVVLDFDLRKAIRYEEFPSSNDQYDFVTASELNTSLRLVTKSKTGTITGTCQDNLAIGGDKIVVYVYQKGKFNKSTETQGQGASDVMFKNCVTSAVVNAQGNYTLSFLEEGDYELHFFGYKDTDGDGKLELKGELELNLTGGLGLNLNNLNVKANGTVNAAVLVIGILP